MRLDQDQFLHASLVLVLEGSMESCKPDATVDQHGKVLFFPIAQMLNSQPCQ